jgi:hypothetical protein
MQQQPAQPRQAVGATSTCVGCTSNTLLLLLLLLGFQQQLRHHCCCHFSKVYC